MDAFSIAGIIFLSAGFVLVGIEMMLPGFGVPGILGAASLVIGILLSAESVTQGLILAGVVLVIIIIMFIIIVALLSKGKLKTPLVLDEELNSEKGYISSKDLQYLLGKEGVADTDLRPSGRGNFEGVTFDVVSEGNYVTKGKNIKIIRVEGSKLIVREMR